MKFVALLLLITTTNVFASEVFSFYYSGFEGRNRVFLSCDYAEDTTYSVLEKLGAVDIEVNCYGGINTGSMQPVSIRASYTKLNQTQSGDILTINSNSGNCFFDTKLIDNLLRNFPEYKIISRRRHCFSSTDSYQYNLETL